MGALYYGWTHCYYSSMELIFASFTFVTFVYSGDGLIFVSCSGEYFECAILIDRLLGVSSMHLDILLPVTVIVWLE